MMKRNTLVAAVLICTSFNAFSQVDTKVKECEAIKNSFEKRFAKKMFRQSSAATKKNIQRVVGTYRYILYKIAENISAEEKSNFDVARIDADSCGEVSLCDNANFQIHQAFEKVNLYSWANGRDVVVEGLILDRKSDNVIQFIDSKEIVLSVHESALMAKGKTSAEKEVTKKVMLQLHKEEFESRLEDKLEQIGCN